MSTQSILVKSIDSIQEKADKNLLENAKKYMLKKRFMLGNGMCRESAIHSLTLLSFICTENCELKDFINRTLLEGEGLEVTCASSKAITNTVEFCNYKKIFENNIY